MEALKELFDKKILGIMSIFLENPGKKYFLSEISRKSKINVTTTFRVLNTLVEKKFVRNTLIGKTRSYELEINKKTYDLQKMMRRDNDPVQEFIDTVSKFPRVKKVILESRENNGAHLAIVGDFLTHNEKIKNKVEEIKIRYNFNIEVVEFSEEQFEKLKKFKTLGFENKSIWRHDS